MKAVGKTHVGKVRQQNEDAISVNSESVSGFPNLFIVADGMGGHNAGEIASSKAIEYFIEYANSTTFQENDVMDQLIAGVNYANKKTFELSKENPEYFGMGTTFTACVFDEKKQKVYIAHIGDTRLYTYKKDVENLEEENLKLLTNDHSYVNMMVKMGKLTKEQAEVHPFRNRITRALGIDGYVQIDGYVEILDKETIMMLCSDGLINMVRDNEIEDIMEENERDIEKMCDCLIDSANNNGGADNISVIVIDVRGDNSET